MSLVSAILQEADQATVKAIKEHRDTLLPKIVDLNERTQLLSWALQQNFIDTYVNFTPTKSLEQLNYINRKRHILSEHEKIIEQLKTVSGKADVIDGEFDVCFKKMLTNISVLNDLCTAVEVKRALEKANQEFGRFNYCDAMLGVKDIQNKLKDLKFEGNTAKALSKLTAQAENQYALYSAQASIEWEDILSWSEKRCIFYLTYSLSVQQSDPILIQRTLKTLYATERLNVELCLFSHFFIEKLLTDIIKHNCTIFTEDELGAIVFNIKIDFTDTSKPNCQTIFNNLTAIFEFLQSTLGSHFECDRTFIAVFSDSIRNKFFNKIIDDCIRNNLPSCDSSYQNYKNLVLELDAFNKFLIDLNFVEADKSPLNKYVSDTECILYNKKCENLLSDVRILLNESLSYGTVTVGTPADNESESILYVVDEDVAYDLNKPLLLPKCVISQNVKQIMTILVEHLEESAKLPEKYSNQLITYVRDVAIMYQCIVPKKFKVNLEYCPLDIALFFNNCFYLAHGLIGPPWRTILPSSQADALTAVLMECIQDLRMLGLEKVSLYLQHQKNIIIRDIESNEKVPWSMDSYEEFNSAVNSALTLMKDLKHNWHNILPTRMYQMSICSLVQTLCQSILQRILTDNKPISEELVYMLAIRINDVIEQVLTLFEEPIEYDKRVNVWNKFTKLPRLLKAQLLEISELWKESKDISQNYACEEVRQIVKMRFPDNKYRLRILKEIQ